jgi:hypothetical protein
MARLIIRICALGATIFIYQNCAPFEARQTTPSALNSSTDGRSGDLPDNGTAGEGQLPPAPLAPEIVSASPAEVFVCPGSPLTLSVTAMGSPLNYAWLKDNQGLTGISTAAITISSAVSADAGIYTARVSNEAGTAERAFAVTVGSTVAVGEGCLTGPASSKVCSSNLAGVNFRAAITWTSNSGTRYVSGKGYFTYANYVVVKGPDGKPVAHSTNICTAGTLNHSFDLPADKRYTYEVWETQCPLRACGGCGYDALRYRGPTAGGFGIQKPACAP